MAQRDETILGLGPVGLAGSVLLVLDIGFRRRMLAFLGLAGIAADVTRRELGGFAALNEPRGEPQGETSLGDQQ